MMQKVLTPKKRCPVCDSRFVSYFRHIPTRRLKIDIPMFYCMECESFFNPSGYVEPEDQLQRDSEWHVSVEDRNTKWAVNFFNAVPGHISSVLEIGCGIGTLLSVAKKKGLDVIGYDTNPYTVSIAAERHGIRVERTIWNHKSVTKKYDLVVCISTLEHLEDPRELFGEMVNYCRIHNSFLFVSVPFIERKDWHYFLCDTPETIENPMYLSDVHVINFSRIGFEKMAAQHDIDHIEFFPYGWFGYWMQPFPNHLISEKSISLTSNARSIEMSWFKLWQNRYKSFCRNIARSLFGRRSRRQ